MAQIRRTNDYVFKRIFGSEEGKEALLGFLNAVLRLPAGRELADVELMDRELDPAYLTDRGARLDVLARTETGTLINIEVQVVNQYNIDKRSLYYWAVLYQGQLASGKKFNSLQKTVTVNVLEFDWFGDERYRHVFHVRDDDTGDSLCGDLEMHFLELKKMRGIQRQPENRLEEWLMYLGDVNSEDLEAIAMANPGIRKAMTIEEIFLHSDRERRIYELREKALRDELSALDGAKAEGIIKGQQDAICQYLEARFGWDSHELTARVRSVSDLGTLTSIMNSIFTVNSLNEARDIILGAISQS